MKKLFTAGAALALALSAGASAQTTTTNQGDANASITGSAAGARQPGARAAQQTPTPRATPPQVTPVRPLSQEDVRRQQEASERRRQEAASGDPDVLLDVPNLSVEEITLKVKNLRAREPRSLEVCALLTKPERRRVDLPIRYVGFEIPNRFAIGYGLDYDERFRNLSYVAALRENL